MSVCLVCILRLCLVFLVSVVFLLFVVSCLVCFVAVSGSVCGDTYVRKCVLVSLGLLRCGRDQSGLVVVEFVVDVG